ncbi:MAG TPA: TIGR04552 family protein [Deltaproteobacteria bacterium]|nr:TIGR04552 family protein [Deltaproteobacteria bacterium]
MIVELSLGEIERARLVLRGGSILDWRSLGMTSLGECDSLLRVNGFIPEEDEAHLCWIRMSAIEYLQRNAGLTFAREICDAASIGHLMLLASGRRSAVRSQACMVLKVMNVVHHIHAMELKSRLNISDRELYHLLEEKTSRVVREMQEKGYPIIDFQSSHKSHDSIITKLLSKRQGNRAFLYDMIRFRLVTATVEEIVPVVAYLSEHLFPFHCIVPGESHNTIFDFTDFLDRHPRVSKMIQAFQVDLMYEHDMRGPSNPDTSNTFKSANFIVDLPLRLDDRQLEVWAPGIELSSRVVHVLAEFQIVDKVSNITNEQGEASHDRYKARRMAKVKERLLRGTVAWKGRDSV